MPVGSSRRARRSPGRRVARGAGIAALGLLGLGAVAAGAAWIYLGASRPLLEGSLALPGLSAPVTVARDAGGVPTVTGTSRADVAHALGFLHGQERFFQMDTIRRSAAGELAALVGDAALPLDRKRRVHRFRARMQAELAALPADDRAVLDAYTAGVNQGLAALGATPFEYALLGGEPQPWAPEDSLLAVVAMYFDLQDEEGGLDRRLAQARATLGPALADFLYPVGTSWDAPIDGTRLDAPPLPGPEALPPGFPRRTAGLEGAAAPVAEDATVPGSNNWAVAGSHSSHGGAIVANDMHLGHGVPNLWYRARLVVTGTGEAPVLDATGVTLPGAPNIVAGSNGRVAWGYTNSQIDTGDVVVLEPGAAGGDSYRTPEGDRTPVVAEERICSVSGPCETLTVRETVWGPVIAEEGGLRLAYRWVAHDTGARALGAALELERAGDVEEAVRIAHRSAIPNQNLMLADRDGRIAWTIIGRVPARVGFDGRTPVSFADGSRRWDGFLPPDRVPAVIDPQAGRLWSANSRVVGGEAFALLGDGGYAHGSRARQIRDALLAQERFDEKALLAIQLDDRGTVLDRWHGLMLEAVKARADDPAVADMLAYLTDWDNRAVPEAVGYRLVRTFRAELLTALYGAFVAPPETEGPAAFRLASRQADEPAWRLLTERPAHLVPPGFAGWDAVVAAALDKVREDVAKAAGGDLSRYRWGERNRAAIRHPLSRFVPGLGWLTDAPADRLPGDVYQPRAQSPSFGASERFAVSPGREAQGLFQMPGGQSGHPLAPYYLAGHDDWVAGRPVPFLPGPARWTLRLEPGAS
ncbi:penicillin acylase II, putative [Rhodospirillum centenum SW]|uniref:Penicillin acylase II, putative n=1 Tax=Rhodospirillum centenum (strain ATCC 51521 / SW) TaxID=414684 RepID=B6IV20_RHOCS|nr:penicillin acylase II, putative [Rhodospirillum centenum SW]